MTTLLPDIVIAHAGVADAVTSGSLSGYPAEQIAVSVPLSDRNGDVCAIAVVPASGQLSLAKARRVMRDPLLRRATLERTRSTFPQLAPSALPPFARMLGVRVLVDQRLYTYNRVICGAGVEGGSLLVDTGTLLRDDDAQLADLCTARTDPA